MAAARVSDGAVVVGTQLGANEHPSAGSRRLEAVAVTVARVVGKAVVVSKTVPEWHADPPTKHSGLCMLGQETT